MLKWERESDTNTYEERVITDYRLNLLFMETNSSKLWSEFLWHMPMCKHLMRTSTHLTGDRCGLTPFLILRQVLDFETSLFHCFSCISSIIMHFLTQMYCSESQWHFNISKNALKSVSSPKKWNACHNLFTFHCMGKKVETFFNISKVYPK